MFGRIWLSFRVRWLSTPSWDRQCRSKRSIKKNLLIFRAWSRFTLAETSKPLNYLHKQAEILRGETLFERAGGQHKTKSTGGEDRRNFARGDDDDEEDEIPCLRSISLYVGERVWMTQHAHSAVRSCVTSQIFEQRGSKDALMFSNGGKQTRKRRRFSCRWY